MSPCSRSNDQLICLGKTGTYLEMETLEIFQSDSKLCLIYWIFSWSNKRWQFDPTCSVLLTFYKQRHRYRGARNWLELVGGLVAEMGAEPTSSEFPWGSRTLQSVLKKLVPVSNSRALILQSFRKRRRLGGERWDGSETTNIARVRWPPSCTFTAGYFVKRGPII